jgi:hypothetical protein
MTDQKNPAKTLEQRMLSFADPIGRFLTDGFHILALFAIGGATVWAAAAAFYASGRGWSVRCRERLDSLASPQTLPPFSSACARMADKVVVGVIASGSTLTCRIEGRPDANARSYAGRNSAVSSTVSPWPPKARA